jgi:UDP-N-acetylglucosamine--N-acetylmuramyl-(pentapeptide) pyrophosphoryl-undecaprenol N-acetylglucosamine transferase
MRIVIAAGGTGGHLTPAAALADELFSRGHAVTLMHDARTESLAEKLFSRHARIVLPGKGVAGRNVFRAASGVLTLAAAALRARRLFGDIMPAALIGFGGYPSVGPVLAALLFRQRPRVILHEQNAILGGANRVLARLADAIALSHPDTARVPSGTRASLTGNPVRGAIAALANAPFDPPGPEIRLLVLGGSQGARIFSDVIPAAIAALPEPMRTKIRIMQQCRPEDLARVRAAYEACGVAADLAAFFPDVAEKLVAAHLVIARSGASTVAELGVVGRPAILVPLPGAVDGDQMLNARAFADGGGGWLMPQDDFSAQTLAKQLRDILEEPAFLAEIAAGASKLGHADAASRLADLVEKVISRETLA